ncbi:MAG: hypothetical protein ACYDEE_14380 [Ignavibacteriaceae bacterium]
MGKKILEYYISDQDKNNSNPKKKASQPKKAKVIIPDKSNKLCQMILEKIESSKPKVVPDNYQQNIEIVKSSIALLSECSNLLLQNKKDMKNQHIRDCRTSIKNMYKIHMEIREQLESGKK